LAALELPPYQKNGIERRNDIMIITPLDFFIFSPRGDFTTYPFVERITSNNALVNGKVLSFLNTNDIKNNYNLTESQHLNKVFNVTASLTLHKQSQAFQNTIIFIGTKYCEIKIPSELTVNNFR
jgi:hypothetical protein